MLIWAACAPVPAPAWPPSGSRPPFTRANWVARLKPEGTNWCCRVFYKVQRIKVISKGRESRPVREGSQPPSAFHEAWLVFPRSVVEASTRHRGMTHCSPAGFWKGLLWNQAGSEPSSKPGEFWGDLQVA